MLSETFMKVRIPALAAAITAALLVTSPAFAQIGPGPGGPGGPGTEEDKPAGIAEKAPTVPGTLPTTPILPAPKAKKKRFQVFELNGYFRWRGDYFKDFHLGFSDDLSNPATLGAPFRPPLSCASTADGAPCGDTIKSSNIRMRLEPVINIDEKASVHMQIDVLDNLVLGSTPDGAFGDGTPRPTNIPVNGFSGGQVDPQAGRNSLTDSIRVKRAWAEVMTPLGLVKFGRQPSHWGLGILANSGGEDPFHGTYDLDSDYGDTADRLMFGTMIPGTQYRVAVATDWASTTPTAGQTDVFRNRYDGQPFDLEDADDVNQWLVVLARLDKPEDFQDTVDQGEIALNYGGYFVYRTQGWDTTGLSIGGDASVATFARRDAKAYIPDVWVHLGHKKLDFEAEAVAIVGSIGSLSDVFPTVDEELDIRQFGGVAKVGYKMVDDKLRLGMEVGYASGDQWDPVQPGRTNVRDARAVPCANLDSGVPCNDRTSNAFKFDFAYTVDLILFRELLGAVTNATYLRPTLSYDLTKSINFKFQSVLSFANKPVATPGNGSMYGVEFDTDLGYSNEGFFAGVAAGVLFPLSAMDQLIVDSGGNSFVVDAGNAWTLQTRLALQF
jgi:uncharacterized protein (TIGR04551 family)